MADAKISALAAASALTGTEVAPVVQSSSTKKATVQQFATAITGATGTNGETVTASKPRFDLTQTWNNVSVTFTGLKFNVTDTASAAGSLLMDLQVGGVSQASISKAGFLALNNFVRVNANTASGGVVAAGSNGFQTLQLGGPTYGNNGICAVRTDNLVAVRGSGGYAWENGLNNPTTGTLDLVLVRDAANTLAQRNSTNAQTARLYGTYTDASNYRRLAQTMSATGIAEIKPEGAGTGASGNVLHISGLPTSNPGPGILWNNGGTVVVGT